MSAETLRRAADRIEQRAEKTGGPDWKTWLSFGARTGQIPPGTAQWVNTLGPQVAAPLVAWLRAEADEQAEQQADRTSDCLQCDGTGQVYDGDPVSFRCTDCRLDRDDLPALILAHTILGETP